MGVRLIVPHLHRLAGGRDTFELTGSSIADCLDELEAQLPGSKSQICDEAGQVHADIAIFVREKGSQFHSRGELSTPLKDGDELLILPVISGG